MHISFDPVDKKYRVLEPAVIEPSSGGMRCSKCKTKLPLLKRDNGAIRILLIPKDKKELLLR
jgi:hypothetical protein